MHELNRPNLMGNEAANRIIKQSVMSSGGCWIWLGATSAGYGTVGYESKSWPTHRLMYWLCVDNDIQGKHIHHKCLITLCVNPAHLEALTAREHMGKSPNWVAHQKRMQTHCKHGHLFDEANTYIRKDGRRQCKSCMRSNINGGRVPLYERLQCLRCKYEWYPRRTDVRICPTCKSARWNEPR